LSIEIRRAALALLGAVLVAASLPPGVSGQERSWSVDAASGLAIPVGDLADYYDMGLSVEGTVEYRLHPRVRARLMVAHHPLPGADWDNVEPVEWEGEKPQGPEARFSYVLAGASVPATSPEREGWEIVGYAGMGAARVELEPTDRSLGGTYVRPAAGGGLELSHPIGSRVSVLGRSVGLLFLRTFDGGVTGRGFGFGKELTFSYTAGLRIEL